MNNEQLKVEFEKILTKAKRSGFLKAHYPEQGLAILELKLRPDEPAAAEPAPAAPPAV